MTKDKHRGEQSRRRRRRGAARQVSSAKKPVWPGLAGGQYRPFSKATMERMHEGVLKILSTVGMSETPEKVISKIVAKGGEVNNKGRLLFPPALVEDVIAQFERDFTLYGRESGTELELKPGKVHVGSGGAAPSVIDLKSERYRDGTLKDLYDAARICDVLENIHFFSRSVVARDIETPLDFDINTAYACLAGTGKHVMVQAMEGHHVPEITALCDMIAGNHSRFCDQPFLSLNVNHVVSPLRFMTEACDVIEQAALNDIPIFMNSFGQAGASTPAALAGAVLQSIAETLAGMIYAWSVNPKAKVIFGPRPLITDLRTGALAGGCGEHAATLAAGAQMGQFYGLPNSCISGSTDAKIPDAQSGYEKALAVTHAALAGSNMVTQACGMQAGMMGVAYESYVIDNDMLGAVLRSVRGIETNEIDFSEQTIEEAVSGDGHFLGHMDTMARMETDYLYPMIADRRTVEEWELEGSKDIRSVARDKAREILSTHHPIYLNKSLDLKLRAHFNIKL